MEPLDVHSREIRSFNMSRIKGKDTKPEILVRKWLWAQGYRYRLHSKNLPGKPDIVFPSRKKVVFVHGCFWHKHDCDYFKWPATKPDFWKKKIGENVRRDKSNYDELQTKGWRCFIAWECDLRKAEKRSNLLLRLASFLDED